MFSPVSWQVFFSTCILTLLVYYLAIGILFYRAELLSLWRGRTGRTAPADRTQPGTGRDIPPSLDHAIRSHCSAAGTHPNRAEFLYGLQRIMTQYKVAATPALQGPLTRLIQDCAREMAGLELDETDICLLWCG